MKFRAELVDFQTLLSVVQALEKLGKMCMMQLSENDLRFTLNADQTEGEQAFVELPHVDTFQHWRIESKNNNEIPFIISLAQLVRVLKSPNKPSKIVMKLRKHAGNPMLNFEIHQEGMQVQQDIPISMLSPDKMNDFLEPELPEPRVKIRMPSPKSLSVVVARMKMISEVLKITARSSGEIELSAEADEVTIRTFYKGLHLKPATASGAPPVEEKVETTTASLSMKKFGNILHSNVLPSMFALACIVDKASFVLYMKLKENKGVVTYYIPLLQE